VRVLQVVHTFPPYDWTGTELVTFYLAQALQARGHVVTVFTRIADPTLPEFSLREEQWAGLPVVRVVNNYTQTTSFRLAYDNAFFHAPFVHLLDRLQPDVVHFQHCQNLSVSLLPLAVALGYPTALSLHDFFFPCHRIHLLDAQTRLCAGPEQGARCVRCLQELAPPEEVRRRFTYMEQVLQAPDVVVAPSRFLAQKIQSYFPSLERQIRTIPLGITRILGVARDRPATAPLRILYVGVLLPHKGAHVLIEALKGVPVDAIEVSIYGAVVPQWQEYGDRLHETARGFPVHFHSPYSHDQLASILSRHDVLVAPMMWEETFSILTHEALAAGLPVIAARRGALTEAVQDGVNGLLFEPENATDLWRCLMRLLTEPGLLDYLRATPSQEKTMEEYARDIEEVYEELFTAQQRRLPVKEGHTVSRGDEATLQQCDRAMTSTRTLILDLSAELATLRKEGDQLREKSAFLEQQLDRVVQDREVIAQDREVIAQDREVIAQDREVIAQDRDRIQQERDEVTHERNQAQQERDRLSAQCQELGELLDVREEQLLERNTRLAAIYASTTWKVYRVYAVMVEYLVQRPVGMLRHWLTG
jgi:glycosyltransferase involved in cell wall biosynthesis